MLVEAFLCVFDKLSLANDYQGCCRDDLREDMIEEINNTVGQWKDFDFVETGVDILMDTLDWSNFGVLRKSYILREFLTVVGDEGQEEFENEFNEVCSIVFHKQQKTTRDRLRNTMKKTGFDLALNF